MSRWLSGLLILGLLAGCDERGETELGGSSLTTETPDGFIQFLNRQPSLAAGDYELVAATESAAEAGPYELRVEYDDGTVRVFRGTWVDSGGPDPLDPGNPRHAVQLPRAGGIKATLTAVFPTHLVLLREGYAVATAQAGSGPDANASRIDLPASRINNEAYARAYYRAVDPLGNRTTVADWKQANGFGACDDYTHVIFRDTKDLGYGRNMEACRHSDGRVAVVVENYVVRVLPGDSANYGPLNLEAAIMEDRQHVLGFNAIEFSPPEDPLQGSDPLAKFYTFTPEGKRLLSADLDGRGEKFMPGICVLCHGASLYPLDEDGEFPLSALRGAKLNQLEVDSFEYSRHHSAYTREQQEAGIRLINDMVADTYADMDTRADDQQARWAPGFARALADGRYQGDFAASLWQDEHVPEGWQQNGQRPEGVELLYKRVVEPNCIACHSLRGFSAAEAAADPVTSPRLEPMANAINFETYERFISFRERIADYVYRRGVMPLSLRNFEAFWRDPEGPPALLASFLDDDSLYDESGNLHRPGLPIARPGADRQVSVPVTLDATASSFARQYEWRISEMPMGASPTLDDTTSGRPVFDTDLEGEYRIELVVGNRQGRSAPEELRLTVDHAQPDLYTFEDVLEILWDGGDGTGSAACLQCHRPAGIFGAGVPVYYHSANEALYEDIRNRVNLADPELSLLLQKPTQPQHGGGIQIDLESQAGREDYNILLNWIRQGALCGDGAYC